MRTFKDNRDELLMLVIKISTIIILCLLLFNALNIMAQSMPNKYSVGKGNNLREKVREIYTSQIGVREKPVNSGPQVEKYLKYVGLSKGNPWCAAFVCWVLGEAGVSNPRTGWSPALFRQDKIVWERGESGKLKGERSGKLLDKDVFASAAWQSPTGLPRSYPPRPITCLPDRQADYRLPITHSSPTTGDVFGLFFLEKGRIAHTGFIDQWDGTWMISVEGNTNIAGTREGDGVYRKRRLVRSVYKVARYINY